MPKELTSSQIAAYICQALQQERIEPKIPITSTLLCPKRYLERRIEEIRIELQIPIVNARGSRAGRIESDNVDKIMRRLSEESNKGSKGRPRNLQQIPINDSILDKARELWEK